MIIQMNQHIIDQINESREEHYNKQRPYGRCKCLVTDALENVGIKYINDNGILRFCDRTFNLWDEYNRNSQWYAIDTYYSMFNHMNKLFKDIKERHHQRMSFIVFTLKNIENTIDDSNGLIVRTMYELP